MKKTNYKERFLDLDGQFSTALTALQSIQLIANKAVQGHHPHCDCALCLVAQKVNTTLKVV